MEESQTQETEKLPDDIVFDILSRLPVQSILRFKCICKSWLSILSDPKFIRTHLHRSTQSADRRRLLLRTDKSPFSFLSFDFETPNHEEPTSLQCPWENSEQDYRPILPSGSSDGLILLSLNERDFGEYKYWKSFLLWNPSNRSRRSIACPYMLPFYSLYGICYDSAADDYKVLIVSQSNHEFISVVVYSSRNDSWNIFPDNRYKLFVSNHWVAVNVNGAVHWVLRLRELDSYVVVYFDLVEGMLKEVPSPSFWSGNGKMNVVVLGGFLCVYHDDVVEQIEVYAMREYGKKESWARLFVIPCAQQRMYPVGSYPYVKPLCLTKKGQVVIFIGDRGIGLYDPKVHTISRYDSIRGRFPIPYVETLVSLDGRV